MATILSGTHKFPLCHQGSFDEFLIDTKALNQQIRDDLAQGGIQSISDEAYKKTRDTFRQFDDVDSRRVWYNANIEDQDRAEFQFISDFNNVYDRKDKLDHAQKVLQFTMSYCQNRLDSIDRAQLDHFEDDFMDFQNAYGQCKKANGYIENVSFDYLDDTFKVLKAQYTETLDHIEDVLDAKEEREQQIKQERRSAKPNALRENFEKSCTSIDRQIANIVQLMPTVVDNKRTEELLKSTIDSTKSNLEMAVGILKAHYNGQTNFIKPEIERSEIMHEKLEELRTQLAPDHS